MGGVPFVYIQDSWERRKGKSKVETSTVLKSWSLRMWARMYCEPWDDLERWLERGPVKGRFRKQQEGIIDSW